MTDQKQSPWQAFASLNWYDETIKFTYNFVAKTSELLLTAGVVISSANFLTDGAIMQDNTPLSIAWAWAQALAIDSSLGIVFVNGFQAFRARDHIKGSLFFLLAFILASVAGLLTHFDALSHAVGLPVTDKSISGIIPLWILTAMRAIAVIGYLLMSRLKNHSFNQPKDDQAVPTQTPATTSLPTQPALIDYDQLAQAIVTLMQQANTDLSTNVNVETEPLVLPQPIPLALETPSRVAAGQRLKLVSLLRLGDQNQQGEKDADARIIQAYQEIKAEREVTGNQKPISARDLATRANVRRSTCSSWLKGHDGSQQPASVQEIFSESMS